MYLSPMVAALLRARVGSERKLYVSLIPTRNSLLFDFLVDFRVPLQTRLLRLELQNWENKRILHLGKGFNPGLSMPEIQMDW